MTTSPSNREAALALAAKGHPVLPLHSPLAGRYSCGARNCSRIGKHPRGVYGLKSASTDPERIGFWWHGQPSANVGMRCDGLLVVDLDYGGAVSLHELEWELGELPETRIQSSGRGEHRFFATPAGVLLGNSTAALGHPKGLHLRGDRGYVVAAPSLHPNGRRYAWRDPKTPIAELPEPWLEKLLELPELPAERSAGGKAERDRIRALAAETSSTRYGLSALAGELVKLRSAQEGTRNETLNRAGFPARAALRRRRARAGARRAGARGRRACDRARLARDRPDTRLRAERRWQHPRSRQ
jgi:bifunctional DNA primase/polymerase-like protein